MSPRSLLNKYAILRDFLKAVGPRKVKGISSIIAFGSAATGKATAESDIDIIVLLKSENAAVKDVVRGKAYQVMEKAGFKKLISLHFMVERKFAVLRDAGYSFEKEIEEEGVPLWQAR